MQITIDTRETLSVQQALHLASLLTDQDVTTLKIMPVVESVEELFPGAMSKPAVEPAASDPVATEPAAPKKRKRRTKAQLAAAKRQDEEDAAILAAAKDKPAEPASPPVAAAAEKATPPAAPLEESTPPPPSPGVLSTSDMKSVVGQALARLTDAGDENAAKTIVDFLTATTGKRRISEIGADLYPEVAASLRELEHTPDPLA